MASLASFSARGHHLSSIAVIVLALSMLLGCGFLINSCYNRTPSQSDGAVFDIDDGGIPNAAAALSHAGGASAGIAKNNADVTEEQIAEHESDEREEAVMDGSKQQMLDQLGPSRRRRRPWKQQLAAGVAASSSVTKLRRHVSTGRYSSSCLHKKDVCKREFGMACCAGMCVDLSSNRMHCGSCGHHCPLTHACCHGSCADLSLDPLNCGRCGNTCPDRTCQFGLCGYY